MRYVPAWPRWKPEPPRYAQLDALPGAALRRFLAYLAGWNTATIELPLSEFLADLAVRAEWADR